MKVIDLLVKKANGEEIPKIIEYRTNYYKLVERNEGNFNYRLIDYPSMRECDDYLEDDYYLFNILNHEVEIIEDTPKEEIQVLSRWYPPKEDKKIEKFKVIKDNLGDIVQLDYEGMKLNITILPAIILDKINEIIDKINGEENES